MSPTQRRIAKRKIPARRASGRIGPENDDRAAALLEEMRRDRQLSTCVADYERNRDSPKFGANALKVGSKLFALFTQGTLVVKLPRERVEALVAAGAGAKLQMGKGRAMNEWLALTGNDGNWLERVREASSFVSSLAAGPPRSRKAKRR